MNRKELFEKEIARIEERIAEGEILLVKYPESQSLIAGQIGDKNMVAMLRKDLDLLA